MWTELAFLTIQQVNPGMPLQKLNWQEYALAWTTLEGSRVEVRKGRCKKRSFCPSRTLWKSFVQSAGSKKFT
jgi:hypothetical protein